MTLIQLRAAPCIYPIFLINTHSLPPVRAVRRPF